jgi:hypothetical protein
MAHDRTWMHDVRHHGIAGRTESLQVWIITSSRHTTTA